MVKLLIIGAGIGQMPLLQKAKHKGFHVTVATIPGEYPCIPIADDIIFKDIYDMDGIVEEARKREITAVISDQNDLMNPTVAYVSEKLGLPGNKYSTVLSYCNKNNFMDMCDKIGIPTPNHISVSSKVFDYSDFACPFPWIVKPADSQSSIGIRKIDEKVDLSCALSEAIDKSPTKNAIIEEFFVGKEIVCEGFIIDGKYYNLAYADRKYFESSKLFIPSQTLFPSIMRKELLEQVLQFEKKLAEYSNPKFAIVHSEYLINEKNGEIKIVESALRGGGVFISSDLIPMATGIDINEILLNKAVGNDVDIDLIFEKKKNMASAYICFYLPEGVVESIRGTDRLLKKPFVHKAFLNDIFVGKFTEPMTYKGARKGPIIVSGKNRQDLENNISVVQKILQIDIKSPDGIIEGIKWD